MARRFTFRPIPMIPTKDLPMVTLSAMTPHIFLSRMRTSFGHLIDDRKEEKWSTVIAAASEAMVVIRPAIAVLGLRITETKISCAVSESQLLSKRPLPLVCSSANIAVPWRSDSLSGLLMSSWATSMVEVVFRRWMMRVPMRPWNWSSKDVKSAESSGLMGISV